MVCFYRVKYQAFATGFSLAAAFLCTAYVSLKMAALSTLFSRAATFIERRVLELLKLHCSL